MALLRSVIINTMGKNNLWIKKCEEKLQKYSPQFEKYTEELGITWFEINKASRSAAKKPILFLSPHSDDLEISSGVTIMNHCKKNDFVIEILLTCGSTGRAFLGYSESELRIIRLAEALMSAEKIGIKKIGVVTKVGSNELGLDEWFWSGNDKSMREFAISFMRKIDPKIIYSPYPDVEVDSHVDHNNTALLAEFAVKWGSENDFYQERFSGNTSSFIEWRRYSVWPGKRNMIVNFRTLYDKNSVFAKKKKEVLSYFQSQDGAGYAELIEGFNVYQGGLVSIGKKKMMLAEVFDVWTKAREEEVK